MYKSTTISMAYTLSIIEKTWWCWNFAEKQPRFDSWMHLSVEQFGVISMVNKSTDHGEVVNTLTEKGVSGMSLAAAYPISNEHYDKNHHYTTCRSERNGCQWRVLGSVLLQNFAKFCKNTCLQWDHTNWGHPDKKWRQILKAAYHKSMSKQWNCS